MTMLEDDLVGVAGAIWESVLGMAVVPIPTSEGQARLGGHTLTACVHITGEWEGTVALAFPPSLCTRIAAEMFAMDPAELDDELVKDALGEIANIAGGNVKGMLAATTTLSLPQIVEGDSYTVSIPGAHLLCEAAFDSEGEAFTFALYGRSDLPAGA